VETGRRGSVLDREKLGEIENDFYAGGEDAISKFRRVARVCQNEGKERAVAGKKGPIGSRLFPIRGIVQLLQVSINRVCSLAGEGGNRELKKEDVSDEGMEASIKELGLGGGGEESPKEHPRENKGNGRSTPLETPKREPISSGTVVTKEWGERGVVIRGRCAEPVYKTPISVGQEKAAVLNRWNAMKTQQTPRKNRKRSTFGGLCEGYKGGRQSEKGERPRLKK